MLLEDVFDTLSSWGLFKFETPLNKWFVITIKNKTILLSRDLTEDNIIKRTPICNFGKMNNTNLQECINFCNEINDEDRNEFYKNRMQQETIIGDNSFEPFIACYHPESRTTELAYRTPHGRVVVANSSDFSTMSREELNNYVEQWTRNLGGNDDTNNN